MNGTYNKNLNPLLNLLINFIFAKSTSQILSIKGECTFLLLNFLLKGQGNLIICCMASQENYVGLVGPQNNNNNPKFPVQHI